MLQRFTTSELETLVQKFPYFQQGHLLLAKKYQLENSPKFDEQLQLAALYTQNRELLYELFKKVSPEDSNIIGINETASESSVTSEELHIDNEPAVQLVNETAQTITVPEIELQEATEQESSHAFELIEEEVKSEGIEVHTETFPDTEDNSTEIDIQENHPIDIKEPHTFNDWLKVFSYNTTVVDNPESASEEAEAAIPEQPDELEELIQQNISVDYLHELVEEETRYSKGLDAFIAAQIQRHRAPSATKNTDENVLHDDLVTETLAKLYESQRKYSKAIKAYETLAIKFPEKNDLFAARIQYLKNLI